LRDEILKKNQALDGKTVSYEGNKVAFSKELCVTYATGGRSRGHPVLARQVQSTPFFGIINGSDVNHVQGKSGPGT
jgi:hypothetical protein